MVAQKTAITLTKTPTIQTFNHTHTHTHTHTHSLSLSHTHTHVYSRRACMCVVVFSLSHSLTITLCVCVCVCERTRACVCACALLRTTVSWAEQVDNYSELLPMPVNKMAVLESVKPFLRAHYISNVILACLFFIVKSVPGVCSTLFHDCKLELVNMPPLCQIHSFDLWWQHCDTPTVTVALLPLKVQGPNLMAVTTGLYSWSIVLAL